jgi:organic hydroperoxide reductase OsmC/OhrA
VPSLRVSAARTFFGERNAWNPETLLLAALAQCHLSAFLRQAGLAGLEVTDASVSVTAWLSVMPDGAGRLTRAELTPRTVVVRPAAAGPASPPEGDDPSHLPARLERLHAEAHRQCFIANSVNFPVLILPEAAD